MTNGELLLITSLKTALPILVCHFVIRLKHKPNQDTPKLQWLEYLFVGAGIVFLGISLMGFTMAFYSTTSGLANQLVLSFSLFAVTVFMYLSHRRGKNPA